MPFDKSTRGQLQRFVNTARTLLSDEFARQLQQDFGLNPESGEPWRDAEVQENISIDLLKQGQPASDYMINALIEFMQTLTDQRYEKYLEE